MIPELSQLQCVVPTPDSEVGPYAKGKWFVIHAKPRQEHCALENLERQGYECFLPLSKVQKIRAGKCVEEIESLFPRYLFIRLVEGVSNFSPIRSTRGVSGLVRFAGVYACVYDQLIENIRVVHLQREPLLKPGDWVEVTSGPFVGFSAECIELLKIRDGEMRAMVMLEFLSKMQRVSIPVTELRKVT